MILFTNIKALKEEATLLLLELVQEIDQRLI